MTDSHLIERCQQGDTSAFNILVWRWQHRVYNFVLRYVGHREDAKDISQKTFIKAYRNMSALKDEKKFSTWLYQIAVNLCRDELKKRNRRSLYSLDLLQENGNSGLPSLQELTMDKSEHPETHACQCNLNDLLNRALQEIPKEQRIVIIMKEYEGLKFHEIADILGTSINTVKSRMYYGLTALKKVFKQWNISEELLNYDV